MEIFLCFKKPFSYFFLTIRIPSEENNQVIPSKGSHYAATAKPSPIVVSTGVISKRAAVLDNQRLPVEFKINISDSEVVLIEDTCVRDSSAVILKGTAILTYRPQIQSKPFSCHLNRVEIFSSQLNLEDETALSIVDPATISIEVVGKTGSSDVKGILDATSSELHQTLEIQAQQVILRLSYNDMKLFLRILDTLPRHQAHQGSSAPGGVIASASDDDVERLRALGFSAEDCRNALAASDGQLEEAALWLTQNASASEIPPQGPSSGESQVKIRAIELRTGCISLCVIDDCRDADVPLLEIAASQLLLRQSIDGSWQRNEEGSVNCQFSVDYYNRILSGWEPFVEPFKCHVTWNFLPFVGGVGGGEKQPVMQRQRRSIFFESDDVVNVNCTRALLELFRTVKMNWMEDYYSSSGKMSQSSRQRSPFVPFALHNATGSRLRFRCVTASLLTDASAPTVASNKPKQRWINCEAGDVVAFSFENRGKLRHHDSHEMQARQLVVELDGWVELVPVSVDRVGVYFRYAAVSCPMLQY